MRIAGRATEAMWWDIARACDYATFFHTPVWHRLAEQSLPGHRDISFLAHLEDGARAVFPLLQGRRRPVGGAVLSTFAGCYGGAIADRELTVEEQMGLIAAADRRFRHVRITGNPLAGAMRAPPGFRALPDVTHLLSLDRPYGDVAAGFSAGHRRSIERGRRSGVTTRVTAEAADYRRYFSAYEATLARWGASATSRYPWALFRRGQELAVRYPDLMALWIADLEGSLVAGCWVFYWNGHAVYWHGASTAEGRESHAGHVLLADIIADAKKRDCRWFDFNPSGGHESVAEFKRRFGSVRMPFVRFERHHSPGREAARLLDWLSMRRSRDR